MSIAVNRNKHFFQDSKIYNNINTSSNNITEN